MTVPRKEVLAEGVEVWLWDCREILPALGRFDAFVADPPYGVGGQQNTKTGRRARKNGYGKFIDSPAYVLAHAVPAITWLVKDGIRSVVTPGNACFTLYPMPKSFGAIYQPASVGLQAWGRADAQPILYYGKSPYGGTQLPGQKCSYILNETAEKNGHPCPKPIKFWTSIVRSVTIPTEHVIDPYLGSGTTGVAAVKLGRRFTGIEIDEGYFDIACRRIEAALKEPDLFVEPPKPAKQEALAL